MAESRVHLFGIRHHGPGSARNLEHALNELAPDCLLIEGPPDAQDILSLASHQQMQPPVAMLVYVPDDPSRAAFYPFASFSPEWRAIQYGLKRQIQMQFMDLPQWFGLAEQEPLEIQQECPAEDINPLRHDPLGYLAQAAGFSDGERWWDHMVEGRHHDNSEIFAAVAEAMTALREELADSDSLREQRREAFMRKTLREAMKQDYQRIAVVCGAWHVPALNPDKLPPAKHDNDLLKGLKKTKTQAAWSPWTYDRLALGSGYGAGVVSPAWYELLWSDVPHVATYWLTKVARLMRDRDMDTSSAHVIEAVRLAQTLAAMRSRPLPGLEELNEAALTVICAGHDAPMQLISSKLIIGDRMGCVPDDAPMAPLQRDLTALQKRLRLPVTTEIKPYDLDLRKDIDLQRSCLMHRLNLLNIPWGQIDEAISRTAKGTFHEFWQVQWRPEFIIKLIEGSCYGNTVQAAASSRTIEIASKADNLVKLTELLDHALLADLPNAVEHLVTAIQNKAAGSSDIPQLMASLPPLARVIRYGNVRQTDATLVHGIFTGILTRICVGLPGVCSSLNDDAAGELLAYVVNTHGALNTLADEDMLAQWFAALHRVVAQASSHPLLAGRAVRILHDSGTIPSEETARNMSLALSLAIDRLAAAAWIEGFLRGSGLILIHDAKLWSLIDQWVSDLKDDAFVEVLPLLRRTFATFETPERRQMGEQLKRGSKSNEQTVAIDSIPFNHERAAMVLPLIAQLLGTEVSS